MQFICMFIGAEYLIVIAVCYFFEHGTLGVAEFYKTVW